MLPIKQLIIWIHLLIASLIAPFIIMVAVSGGLYLFGIKGNTEKQFLELPINTTFNFESDDLASQMRALLDSMGIADEFEYIKNRGNLLQTRPTSKIHYELNQSNGKLSLSKIFPDLQKSMIELHKGHGPLAFKWYQKFVAISLMVILLTGVIAGLLNPRFKGKTVSMLVVGTLIFFGLAVL